MGLDEDVSANQRIKILWFVNSLFPEAAQDMGVSPSGGGWWLVALANELRVRDDVELVIATFSAKAKREFRFKREDLEYYVLPESFLCRNLKKIGMDQLNAVVGASLKIIQDIKPDVIVSHGTENGYGLLAPHVKIPVLVELQGILNGYLPHFWGGIRNPFERLMYPRAVRNWFSMRRRAKNERKVFKLNHFFVGRTFWDQSQLFRFNPDAKYFFERRVLRPEFLSCEWNLDHAKRNSIYTTTTPHFLKGTACLVEALALLKRKIPDAKLRIGGLDGRGEVGRYLKRKIKKLDLVDSVDFLGYLSSSKIADCLLDSHAYVIPSYIENNANNLCEAMVIGTPSIASSAGGLSSVLKHEEEGLIFNSGDSAMLATSLLRIFSDDQLAKRLSRTSRIETLKRHDAKQIANAHIEHCRYLAASNQTSS